MASRKTRLYRAIHAAGTALCITCAMTEVVWGQPPATAPSKKAAPGEKAAPPVPMETPDMSAVPEASSAPPPAAATPSTPSAAAPEASASSTSQAPSAAAGLAGRISAANTAASAASASGGSGVSAAQGTSATTQSNPAAPSSVVNPSAAGGASAGSTGQALQAAPSVSIRRTSALNLDPRIRGYHSGQINATASGMPQIKTRVDIDSLFSQVDIGIVQNITVIDGPYTSLWGPGFAFLVAELFPTERYDQLEAHVGTAFSHETNGRQLYARQNIKAGGQIWGVYASIGKRVGNDYSAANDVLRVPSSYNQWDGYVAASLDLTSNSRVEFQYIHTEQNNVELPGIAYDINQSTNHQYNARFVVQDGREGPERVVLQAWYGRTDFNGDSFRTSKQATLFPQLFGVPSGPFANIDLVNLNNNGQLQSNGVRGLMNLGERDGINMTLGADWRRESTRYIEINADSNGGVTFDGSFFGIPESSIEDWGIFSNVSLPASESLLFTVGGRVDQYRARFDPADAVQTVGATPPAQLSANNPRETLYMAYLTGKQELGEKVNLTGGVAFAMRGANLAELYSDQPFAPIGRFGNSFTIGNPDLRPEKNLQFDLGLQGNWEWVSFSVRGFHSTVNDYILYVPNTVGDANVGTTPGDGPFNLNRRLGQLPISDDTSVGYTYTNLDRATLWGGDAAAEVKILPWLAVNGTLSYVKGTNHSPRELNADGTDLVLKGAEGLPGIYPFNVSFAVRAFEPEEQRYGAEFSARFVRQQEFVADSIGEARTPGFAVCDARAFWRVTENIRLATTIKNILNQSYTQHGSLAIADPRNGRILFVPEPGISWVTSFELNY